MIMCLWILCNSKEKKTNSIQVGEPIISSLYFSDNIAEPIFAPVIVNHISYKLVLVP